MLMRVLVQRLSQVALVDSAALASSLIVDVVEIEVDVAERTLGVQLRE